MTPFKCSKTYRAFERVLKIEMKRLGDPDQSSHWDTTFVFVTLISPRLGLKFINIITWNTFYFKNESYFVLFVVIFMPKFFCKCSTKIIISSPFLCSLSSGTFNFHFIYCNVRPLKLFGELLPNFYSKNEPNIFICMSFIVPTIWMFRLPFLFLKKLNEIPNSL